MPEGLVSEIRPKRDKSGNQTASVYYIIRVPIPHRWKIERTIAWTDGFRRLSKDFVRKNFYGETWEYIASIMMIDNRMKSFK